MSIRKCRRHAVNIFNDKKYKSHIKRQNTTSTTT